MKGHFYKPSCKCEGKRCKCGATWSYIVDIGINPATGKRMQKKKGGFTTKAAAEAHLAELIVDVNNNTFKNESNLTFEAFSDDWLSLYSLSGKCKPSTLIIRQDHIKRLVSVFGKLKMKDIGVKQYQDALFALHERGYSYNTMLSTHGTARQIFKRAMEIDFIKKNPTDYARIPKKMKTLDDLKGLPKKYMKKDELSLFLQVAREHGLPHDNLIFRILAYTGIRSGELNGLKWSDIDFENGTLTVNRTLHNKNCKTREYRLGPPKTETSHRTITLAKSLLNDLETHKAVQNRVKMRFRNVYHDEDFIITHSLAYGYPLNQQILQQRLERLLDIGGFKERVTIHSFRHTHTTLLAEAEVPLPEIMERLGHKNDAVTRNVYLHVTENMKKKSADKFEAFMESI